MVYCQAGEVKLKMDVYFPDTAGERWPVVVYVHGGHWTGGDKSEKVGLRYFDDLVAKNILVVSVNYRLAPEYPFPAPIEDVKCAVRSLRANAGRYNLNPLAHWRIWHQRWWPYHVLAGVGAGPSAGFDNSGGYIGVSSRVQAVVCMYAPSDFTFFCKDDLVRLIFRASDCKDTETLAQASPLSNAGGNASQFLLFHGEKDIVVPPKYAKLLFRALSDAGADVELVLVKMAAMGSPPLLVKLNLKKWKL